MPANPELTLGSISKAAMAKFAKLGIRNRFDLVLHLPLRYEDETQLRSISELEPAVTAQVEGEIIHNEVTFDHAGVWFVNYKMKAAYCICVS